LVRPHTTFSTSPIVFTIFGIQYIFHIGTSEFISQTMSNNNSRKCYFLTFDTTKIDQVTSIYTVVATLDAILFLPTIVLNVLLIVSLYRSSEIRKPTTKLLFSLALSDVMVGLVVEPAHLTKKIAEINHNFANYCITGMVTYVVGGALATVSFFTLTAIAVDRYLVIHTGTKYKTMVTNTRVKLTVSIVWTSALILITAQLYSPREAYFQISAFVAVICVALASMCYIKCFFTLRKYQFIIGNLNERGVSKRQLVFSACNYKKSMHTMAFVFLVFNLCYTPFIFTSVSAAILGESSAIWGAESVASVFIYGNSCINPVILFLRMKEIRRAVVATMSVNSHHHTDKKYKGARYSCNQCQLCRAKTGLQSKEIGKKDCEHTGSHLEELHFDVEQNTT